jgi:PTS system mannose-specific IIA component
MIKERPPRSTIGIIVTHGTLAGELHHTAELIVGKLEDCYPISGSDFCDEEVIARIRDIIDKTKSEKAVVFVDYFGGSCCINSVRAVQGLKGVKVISGVNLPMLLDFATKRDSLEFREMVDHLLRRGRESVKLVDL